MRVMEKAATLFCATLVVAATGAMERMKAGPMSERDAEAGAAHITGATPFGKPGDPKAVSRTVRIEATDYAFSPSALVVARGETVSLVLTNKASQNHELVIGDAAMQESHRQMMTDMQEGGHKPGSTAMRAHAMYSNSVDAKPGEMKTLVWQFTEPGRFTFACGYPGHADLGMEGTITVR